MRWAESVAYVITSAVVCSAEGSPAGRRRVHASAHYRRVVADLIFYERMLREEMVSTKVVDKRLSRALEELTDNSDYQAAVAFSQED